MAPSVSLCVMTAVTAGKQNIALTRWNFVGKVMSLLFNMLYSNAKAETPVLSLPHAKS